MRCTNCRPIFCVLVAIVAGHSIVRQENTTRSGTRCRLIIARDLATVVEYYGRNFQFVPSCRLWQSRKNLECFGSVDCCDLSVMECMHHLLADGDAWRLAAGDSALFTGCFGTVVCRVLFRDRSLRIEPTSDVSLRVHIATYAELVAIPVGWSRILRWLSKYFRSSAVSTWVSLLESVLCDEAAKSRMLDREVDIPYISKYVETFTTRTMCRFAVTNSSRLMK